MGVGECAVPHQGPEGPSIGGGVSCLNQIPIVTGVFMYSIHFKGDIGLAMAQKLG